MSVSSSRSAPTSSEIGVPSKIEQLEQLTQTLSEQLAQARAELEHLRGKPAPPVAWMVDTDRGQADLWHKVIDASPDWLFVKDRNFRYLLANQSYAQAIGKTVEEIIGQDDLELGFPEQLVFGDPEAGIRGFRNDDIDTLAGQTIYNPHDPATTADGTTCTFETQKVPLKDSHGQVFACLGIARDITARKAAEAALQQKVEQETLLNELTGQIRSSLDFDNIVTTAVSKVRRLLGVDHCTFSWYRSAGLETIRESCLSEKAPSLLGLYPAAPLQPLLDRLAALEVLQVDDAGQMAPIWQTALSHLVNPNDSESIPAYQALLLIPMEIRPGLIGILGCFQAASRTWTPAESELLQAIMTQLAIALHQAQLLEQSQTRAEELAAALQQLKSAQSQLVQSEKMSALGQMVAGIAHEINNPVNFIHGNLKHLDAYTQELLSVIAAYEEHYPEPPEALQALLDEVDVEFLAQDIRKLVNSARGGSDRIKEIVLSLRTFSRLDEADFKRVDIHEGIESTLVILQHRLKAPPGQAPIQLERHYGKLPQVKCFPGQLNQVLMNLLSNALDALEETGAADRPNILSIHTEPRPDDRIAIRIADNGGGIPDEVRSRIFDPFFTTKPIGKGTGLGLSISYQIITERHGGKLYCRSTPGQGTEFVIELPARSHCEGDGPDDDAMTGLP